MATFAVIRDGIVENCIVAESLAIAEEVTGLTCIEYTSNNAPIIGITNINTDYVDGYFYTSPQPYPSWILDEDTCYWESPVPYPNDDKMYEWNESTQEWDEIV
jgi:hypothetical protein